MAYHGRHQAVALHQVYPRYINNARAQNTLIEALEIRTEAIGANIHPKKLVLGIHQSQKYDGMEALVVVTKGATILGTPDCHMLAIYGPQGVVEIPSGRKFGCNLLPGITGMGTLQDFVTIFCKDGLTSLSYSD